MRKKRSLKLVYGYPLKLYYSCSISFKAKKKKNVIGQLRISGGVSGMTQRGPKKKYVIGNE